MRTPQRDRGPIIAAAGVEVGVGPAATGVRSSQDARAPPAVRPAARCWLEPATPNYSHSGGSQVSPAGMEVAPPSSSSLGTLPRAGWGGGPREPGVSGNFRGRIKGAKYRFPLQDGTWDFPGDAVAGKGIIL